MASGNFFPLKQGNSQSFFPICVLIHFSFIVTNKVIMDFVLLLNRDARNKLLSALPYNILDWFTWSIIYQFLWDWTQNKVFFQCNSVRIYSWGNATSYVFKVDIHKNNKRKAETLKSLSKFKFLCAVLN